jgi:hypothetical protein
MDAGVLWPLVPFAALLATKLRTAVVLSTAAGAAAGWWLTHVVFGLVAWDRWWWWVLLGFAGAISLAMALAESLVAAIVLRGRFFRGLGLALLAHAAWIAWLFAAQHPRRGVDLLIVMTAMLGASAASVGAARRDR